MNAGSSTTPRANDRPGAPRRAVRRVQGEGVSVHGAPTAKGWPLTMRFELERLRVSVASETLGAGLPPSHAPPPRRTRLRSLSRPGPLEQHRITVAEEAVATGHRRLVRQPPGARASAHRPTPVRWSSIASP